jgi:predicted Ser/Thr protein kinase
VSASEYDLVIEFLKRRSAGENVSVEDFLAKYPQVDRKHVEPILKKALEWPAADKTDTIRQRLEESGLMDLEELGHNTLVTPWTGGNGKEFEHRYNRRSVLGEGGYGKVYLVEDRMHGSELLALKVIRKVHTTGDLEQRFRNEIRVLRTLNHPAIPMIFNDGKNDEGEIYYTMSYIEGRTLGEIIRDEAPLTPERILNLSLQLLEVLVYAHEKGIVHRDLKPSNIIIVADDDEGGETVKVLDFGIAKVLRHEGLLEQAQTMGTEVPLGTPHYMAPEQVRGQVEDGRTDLYALGIIIYQMCSGRLPFQGKTSMEVLIARLENSPRELTSDEAPKWLRDLVAVFLKRDKEKRPTTREALSAFQTAETGLPRVGRDKRLVGALAAGGVLAVLALGWVLFGRGGGEPDEVVAGAGEGTEEAADDPGHRGADLSGVSPFTSEDEEHERSEEDSTDTVPPEPELEPPLAGSTEPAIDLGGGATIESDDEQADNLGENADDEVGGVGGGSEEPSEDTLSPLENPSAQEGPAETNPDDVEHVEVPPVVEVTPEVRPTVEIVSPDWLRDVSTGGRVHRNTDQVGVLFDVSSGRKWNLWYAELGEERKGDPVVHPNEPASITLPHEGEWHLKLFDGVEYARDDLDRPLFEFIIVYETAKPDGASLIDGLVAGVLASPTPRFSGQARDKEPGQLAAFSFSLAQESGGWTKAATDVGLDASGLFDSRLPLGGGDGKYAVTYVVLDAAGNQGDWTDSFVLDTAPPTFEFAEAFWGPAGPPSSGDASADESAPTGAVQTPPNRQETHAGPQELSTERIARETVAASWTLAGTLHDDHVGELEIDGVRKPLDGDAFFSEEVDLEIGANQFTLVVRDTVENSSAYDLVIRRNPLPLQSVVVEVVDADGRGLFPIRTVEPKDEFGVENLPTSSPEGLEAPTYLRLSLPGRPDLSFAPQGRNITVSQLDNGDYLGVVSAGKDLAEPKIHAVDLDGKEISMCTLNLTIMRAHAPDGYVPAGPDVHDDFWFKTIRHVETDMEFVYVEAGENLDAFYIGKYEVTLSEYGEAGGDYPVVDVSYTDARAFCAAIGGRLPRLEEWVRAARKNDDAYPWGNTWKKNACNAMGDGDGHVEAAPVGTFKVDRSWCGAFDMAGNVREYCFGSESRGRMAGGSWSDRIEDCRAAGNGVRSPMASFTGFRVLVETEE